MSAWENTYETPDICDRCGVAGCIGECAIWMPREDATREAMRDPRPVAVEPLTDAEIERRGWCPRPGTYYDHERYA